MVQINWIYVLNHIIILDLRMLLLQLQVVIYNINIYLDDI